MVVLALLFIAGAVLWSSYGEAIAKRLGFANNDYPGPGTGEAIITIYEGDIGTDIADTLAEADVVKTADAFVNVLHEHPEATFHPGSYALQQQMSARGAFDALGDPANRQERLVTLREGLTVEQSIEVLASGTGIPERDFMDTAEDPAALGVPEGVDSLEGWLFPATYEFGADDDAQQILATLVDTQKSTLEGFDVAPDDQQRILTIASIVEKEAGTAEDFPKVARVIMNRLDENIKLEMDSTAQFGMGEHADGNVWSSQEALTDDNPWNTYVHRGLPVGPIANPGAAAIEAALNPAEGSWLYFVVAPGGDGSSNFSDTLEEHHEFVEEYRQWCLDTPESGC